MDADEYQAFTRTTAVYNQVCHRSSDRVTYCLLGLVGEVGEVAEKVKRLWREGGPQHVDVMLADQSFQDTLTKELGDIAWYLARVADEIGLPLGRVLATNVSKLSSRKERGVLRGSGDDR